MPPHSHCVDSRLSVQCPCSLLTLRHHNQFVWDDDGGKWRRQHKRELVGEEWSVVVHVPLRSHWLDAARELLINIVATDFDWPVKVISAIVPETSRIQYFAHVIQTRFQANFWASYYFNFCIRIEKSFMVTAPSGNISTTVVIETQIQNTTIPYSAVINDFSVDILCHFSYSKPLSILCFGNCSIH